MGIILSALLAATIALSSLFTGCADTPKHTDSAQTTEAVALNTTGTAEEAAMPAETPVPQDRATAYFASGCFWCVEAVDEAVSGYAGGHTKNPTYEESNTGRTGHAESVKVIYDPSVISFSQLVDVYFGSQNPTQVNGQGPDQGSQYRSIIFYQNDAEKEIIEKKKAALAKELGEPVAA